MQKIVLKLLAIESEKSKRRAMKTIAGAEGKIHSIKLSPKILFYHSFGFECCIFYCRGRIYCRGYEGKEDNCDRGSRSRLPNNATQEILLYGPHKRRPCQRRENCVGVTLYIWLIFDSYINVCYLGYRLWSCLMATIKNRELEWRILASFLKLFVRGKCSTVAIY